MRRGGQGGRAGAQASTQAGSGGSSSAAAPAGSTWAEQRGSSLIDGSLGRQSGMRTRLPSSPARCWGAAPDPAPATGPAAAPLQGPLQRPRAAAAAAPPAPQTGLVARGGTAAAARRGMAWGRAWLGGGARPPAHATALLQARDAAQRDWPAARLDRRVQAQLCPVPHWQHSKHPASSTHLAVQQAVQHDARAPDVHLLGIVHLLPLQHLGRQVGCGGRGRGRRGELGRPMT